MATTAIPKHVNGHNRNESYDSDGVSRFSADSDDGSNEMGNIPPSSSSHSSTSTMNNNSKKRLCSFNFSKLKKSLRSLLWWKKKDKNNKKTVLPITVEVKEKRKKRRTCCLIILLVIIILLLLGNLIALDVVYLRSPILQSNNITTLLNDGNASDPNSPNAINPTQNFKSITCANMLSLPPKIYPCDFCLDDQAFYNVTTFCALKILWANALNQTALETNMRWMQNNKFCDWVGIKCDKLNNIISLDLSFPNTVKTLDFSLARLTTLQKLTIVGSGSGFLPNDIIPSGIFRFPNLEELTIISTGLSTSFAGSLPNTLDRMISLKSIQFRNNRFLNGSLPESISRTNLTTLIYSAQGVNGPFPDLIGNSPTLQKSLQTLDLSLNQFTGKIDSILNLSNLRSLSLSHNLLSGEPFPLLMSATFVKSLYALNLGLNRFSGTIPPSINQFVSLIDFNLQSNAFTGPIPAEIGSLTKMDAIILNNNTLTGSIPSEISNLSKLTKLILSDNSLTGIIPPIICKNYSSCSLLNNPLTIPSTPCGTCEVSLPAPVSAPSAPSAPVPAPVSTPVPAT